MALSDSFYDPFSTGVTPFANVSPRTFTGFTGGFDPMAASEGFQPGDVGMGIDPFAGYGPRDQYLRSIGMARRQANLGALNDAQLRSAMYGMAPAYGVYQAMAAPAGTTRSFGEYLASNPETVTRETLFNRAQAIADLDQQTGDTADVGMYYTGDKALENQMRLANTLGLAGRGRAAVNPMIQNAVRSAVDRMYQQYLGQGGTTAHTGPTGFLKYYMQRRNPQG